MSYSAPPKEILILGAGVFGLSTALALIDREAYKSSHITVLDSAKILPNPVGSSVDASRIIRADYPYKPYIKLAAEAQDLWRDTSPSGWGGEGRYHETGFVLAASDGTADYVLEAMKNVREMAEREVGLDPRKIEQLDDPAAIQRAAGYGGVSGHKGYANWNSGWGDAEKGVRFALKKLQSKGGDRVTIRANSHVFRLLFEDSTDRCTGAQLSDETVFNADLTILACGAWSPSLLDLNGRCIATGQVLAYLKITDDEAARFSKCPVFIDLSTGIFLIPPNGNELKVARHGYGYRNPQPVHHSPSEVSVPDTQLPIAPEAHIALREGLSLLFPDSDIPSRPFTHTRLCYYTDTPTGNFLIDHHPSHPGLFIATGGSGHGYKFLPVLGEKIVDCIEGKLEPELAQLWRWKPDREVTQEERDFITCDDGSRAGPKGMILEEEMKRQL